MPASPQSSLSSRRDQGDDSKSQFSGACVVMRVDEPRASKLPSASREWPRSTANTCFPGHPGKKTVTQGLCPSPPAAAQTDFSGLTRCFEHFLTQLPTFKY